MPIDELPSYTALTAAAARAAHLIVNTAPTIFADTLASPLLGEQPASSSAITGRTAATWSCRPPGPR